MHSALLLLKLLTEKAASGSAQLLPCIRLRTLSFVKERCEKNIPQQSSQTSRMQLTLYG